MNITLQSRLRVLSLAQVEFPANPRESNQEVVEKERPISGKAHRGELLQL